ncbi:MAG: hypothetical protein OCD02_08190 [Spirochaetaceae bacterium]
MKKTIIFIISICLLLGCTRDITKSLTKSQDIVITSSFDSKKDNKINLVLEIKQPVDHKNPNSELFTQEFYLSHRGFDRPVVVVTDGYSSTNNFNYEVAEILDANLIVINHRYCNNALPNNPDYKYLTIEQAAADHHSIVEQFKDIYNNSKWISSGISKGGMAAIYFKRFYPNDVDVVVPLVAPTYIGNEDKRGQEYFEDEVRVDKVKQITQFQEYVLEHRDEISPLISSFIPRSYDIRQNLTNDEILELLLRNYFFNFWKNGDVENKIIPTTEDSHRLMVKSLIFEVEGELMSTKIPDGKATYYLVSSIGGFYLETKVNYIYDPIKIAMKLYEFDNKPEFQSSILEDINSWVIENGNNIIYVYAEEDPFSYYQFNIGAKTNAVKFMVENEAHLFSLKKMNNYELFIETLMDRIN